MDPDHVRAQLDRILASAAFAGAERASSFLRMVVLRTLSGRAGEIKESVIAVEALGRSPSFNSKSDPIVRVEARRLRDRLDLFYRNEGAGDPIVITLPKGGYVPEFSERSAGGATRPASSSRTTSYAGWVVSALAVVALAWLYFNRAPAAPRSFRLSIVPPENSSFEGFAISPDGRRLAFTAGWKGRTALWLRSLDSFESKPLPGTEDASQPFWSPDSRSIGFFTTSKLKIIDISGGPARDIADTVVGRGGTWSREGVIVFCPKPRGALYQVSADGGAPQVVTALDTLRKETSHSVPHFLPDGRHFLYLAASVTPGASAIRIGSLDGKSSKVLVAGDGGAVYVQASESRPASLLFVHNGVLLAQPFDVRSFALQGEKRVVAQPARYHRWREPGFSVSTNGLLIYQPGVIENRRFTWFDRQGKVLGMVGAPNDFAAFNLSPDHRYLALWSGDDPATPLATVWLMDLSRDAVLSRFSELGDEGAFLPVWSPDGRELLYSVGDERRMRLVRKSLNGGPVHTVLDSDGPKFPSDWSSDGRSVAFSSQWPDYRDMHIWLVQLDAGNPAPKAFAQHAYAEMAGHFSPEGRGKGPRWMAYTSAETGRYEVYIQDLIGGGRRWTVSTNGGWLPQWRRDGRELFYLALDGSLMAVTVQSAGAGLEMATPRSLLPTGLRPTPFQTIMSQYAVSQDGERFLLNTRTPGASGGAIAAVAGW